MLAIYKAKGIKEWDQYTIDHGNMRSIELMEQAAVAFCDIFVTEYPDKDRPCHIFCGSGNNGGDGYAIGRILRSKGYSIHFFKVNPNLEQSADCKANESLISKKPDIGFDILDTTSMPSLMEGDHHSAIAIDAIFGSGLSRPLSEWYIELVDQINLSYSTIVSVDIPSGVFLEDITEYAVKSDLCITFQTLKPCMIHPEIGEFAKNILIADIGLSGHFRNNEDRIAWQLTSKDMLLSLTKRVRFSHKGHYGHALLIGGFTDKVGAVILSVAGALRTGVGKLTIHTEKDGYLSAVSRFPEVMFLSDFSITNNKFDSIAIGPGLGHDEQASYLVESIIELRETRLCFDADALNIIAKNNLLDRIPSGSVLTPHPKEFERLFGSFDHGKNRLQAQIKISIDLQVYIIYKDAYPIITTPRGDTYVSPFGNPGMATGGSGDVLTGMLASFLAQDNSIEQACISSVIIHGMAGDLAAMRYSEPGMKASDITKAIPKILKKYYG